LRSLTVGKPTSAAGQVRSFAVAGDNAHERPLAFRPGSSGDSGGRVAAQQRRGDRDFELGEDQRSGATGSGLGVVVEEATRIERNAAFSTIRHASNDYG
jgi:hypothetical protein